MNKVQRWIADLTGVGSELSAMEQRLSEARGGFEVIMETLQNNRASAGGSVTYGSAMTVAAFWACVRVIAETVGSLPLIVYERTNDGRRRAQELMLYRLLHDQPNELMTAVQLRETMQAHMCMWGNAYAMLFYDARGRVEEIWPLRPDRVMEKRTQGNRRFYHYQWDDGRMEWLGNDVVWQIPGLGGNGLDGYSLVSLFRRSIGLAMDTEEFGARFFSNDARPGIVIEHPATLSDSAYKNLKESWAEEHQGVRNSHKARILEEGMKIHEVGIPPDDAQFLETRQFQVREMARIFRVPPHMIQDLQQATFSNIEHQSLDFVVHTIRPWLVRWEQSIHANLMTEPERARYYAEHLVDGLLRGDIQSRYQAYAVGRQNGWLSANDIRGLENMNPIDGGDVYLVPLNMVPADQVGRLGASQDGGGGVVDTARQLAPRAAREQRSAQMRQRLGLSYRPILLDVAERTIKRETQDLAAAARKMLGKRDTVDFLTWLESFYQEHQSWAARQFLPILASLMGLVAREALDELASSENVDDLVARFAQSYAGSMAHQEAGISQYRLRAALERAATNGQDPAQAVEDELEHWRNTRPADIAAEQATRANNALAKAVYAQIGVQVLRWVTMGDSCPYCNQMNGRTANITRFFLPAGQQIEVDGEEPMTTTTDIGHGPLHKGCDCLIMAG